MMFEYYYSSHDILDKAIGTDAYCHIKSILTGMKAADVVEVRHGRWIGLEYDGYADGYPVYDLWECSECGEEVKGEDVPDTHPWCHACGARMGQRKIEAVPPKNDAKDEGLEAEQ